MILMNIINKEAARHSKAAYRNEISFTIRRDNSFSYLYVFCNIIDKILPHIFDGDSLIPEPEKKVSFTFTDTETLKVSTTFRGVDCAAVIAMIKLFDQRGKLQVSTQIGNIAKALCALDEKFSHVALIPELTLLEEVCMIPEANNYLKSLRVHEDITLIRTPTEAAMLKLLLSDHIFEYAIQNPIWSQKNE